MSVSEGQSGETEARGRQELLRRRLVALGFDEVRFAALAELGGDRLKAWFEAGHHADMQWMERTAEKRLKPELGLAEARAVIMLGVSFRIAQARAKVPTDSAFTRCATSSSVSARSTAV